MAYTSPTRYYDVIIGPHSCVLAAETLVCVFGHPCHPLCLILPPLNSFPAGP